MFQGSQPFSPSVPDGKSKDLFKQQLLRDFYHLLGAFDKSWKEDFLNCYVGKIASLEDRVKAMILCPQMEKFYLYKCKMVLDSVRINPGVPLAPLERIYDQLGTYYYSYVCGLFVHGVKPLGRNSSCLKGEKGLVSNIA